MTTRGSGWSSSWSVDFPGLSEADAVRLVDLAEEQGISDSGCVEDPVHTYVMGLDVATASAMRAALRLAAPAEELTPHERMIAASMAEHRTDWLEARLPEVRSRPDA